MVLLLIIALFALAIPLHFEQLRLVSPQAAGFSGQLTPAHVRALAHLGLSTSFYAGYILTLEVAFAVAAAAIATVIVWRRSDDGMALFVSLTLLLGGAVGTPTNQCC